MVNLILLVLWSRKPGFGMRYILDLVNFFRIFTLTTNHSYAMCSKLNNLYCRWMLMSTVQTSVLPSFISGELFPLFNSTFSIGKNIQLWINQDSSSSVMLASAQYFTIKDSTWVLFEVRPCFVYSIWSCYCFLQKCFRFFMNEYTK